MANTITDDQLVGAAKELPQEEFTRADIAEKLGVKKPKLQRAFKVARKSGSIKKVRDDEQNTGHFRLTDN